MINQYHFIKISVEVVIMLKEKSMQTQEIINALCNLNLNGMAEVLTNHLEHVPNQNLSLNDILELMVGRELSRRDTIKTHNIVKLAGFRQRACAEDIIYNEQRGINKLQMLSLLNAEFIKKGQNVLMTGATGCGKSFIACAIGQHACRFGHKVKYIHLPSELSLLELSATAGRNGYTKQVEALIKPDLLIIDDFGLVPMNLKERHTLFNIIEGRYGLKSSIITSQLPIGSWHDYINEPTIADALLDRVLHNAHRVELKGGSMRKSSSTISDYKEEAIEF